MCRTLSVLSVDLGRLIAFFDFRPLKTPETQKQDWKKTYLFLVTDHSDRYLSWRNVYLNLISYINMSIKVNKLQ